MRFKNRTHAGQSIAQLLKEYKGQDVVVYALPRGGVPLAVEIARYLNAPLDLIIARKVGHPYNSEYAIAAVSEDGSMLGNPYEINKVDKNWLEKEKEAQRQEATRRRLEYLKGLPEVSVKDKIAILVDDGIATGLTFRVGIRELKNRNPKKVIAALPVSPKDTANTLRKEVDEFVCVDVPEYYKGAVGCYYDDFSQLEDDEVIDTLQDYAKEYKRNNS